MFTRGATFEAHSTPLLGKGLDTTLQWIEVHGVTSLGHSIRRQEPSTGYLSAELLPRSLGFQFTEQLTWSTQLELD